LKDYRGKFIIDENYVLDRRKHRYKEEKMLFEQFGYTQLKEEGKLTVYKEGSNKINFAKPHEHRSEVFDCECKA
jgi:hypothetical protein